MPGAVTVLAFAGMAGLLVGAPATGTPAAAPVALPAVAAAVVYSLPVRAPLRVLRPFDPPREVYGPGHRGVDLDAGSSRTVLAAADGTVAFAGPVAGRGVVVIAHADGIRTEYEPARPAVHAGEAVRAGQPIGTVAGAHAGCPSPDCLHWGARRGAVYLDPLALLRGLGPVRLLPWRRGPPGP